jgi:hypothetical protein
MERLYGGFVGDRARTCALAQVIGPWLVIVPGILVLRASKMGALASEFFKSGLFMWFAGAAAVRGTTEPGAAPRSRRDQPG